MTPERTHGYKKELRFAAKKERYGHFEYVSAQYDTELLTEKTAAAALSYDELERLFLQDSVDPELRHTIERKLEAACMLAADEGDDALRLKAYVAQASIDLVTYSAALNRLTLSRSELRRAREMLGLDDVREATIEAAREGLLLYRNSFRGTRKHQAALRREHERREKGIGRLTDEEYADLRSEGDAKQRRTGELKGFIQEETFAGLLLRHTTAAQYAVRSFVYDDMIEEITGHHVDYHIYDNRKRRHKQYSDVQIKSRSDNDLYYDDHITVLDATHLGNSYRTTDWPETGNFQTLEQLINEYDGTASESQKRTLDIIQQRVIRLAERAPERKPLPQRIGRHLLSASRRSWHITGQHPTPSLPDTDKIVS